MDAFCDGGKTRFCLKLNLYLFSVIINNLFLICIYVEAVSINNFNLHVHVNSSFCFFRHIIFDAHVSSVSNE